MLDCISPTHPGSTVYLLHSQVQLYIFHTARFDSILIDNGKRYTKIICVLSVQTDNFVIVENSINLSFLHSSIYMYAIVVEQIISILRYFTKILKQQSRNRYQHIKQLETYSVSKYM